MRVHVEESTCKAAYGEASRSTQVVAPGQQDPMPSPAVETQKITSAPGGAPSPVRSIGSGERSGLTERVGTA
jgi:hypothetical protein